MTAVPLETVACVWGTQQECDDLEDFLRKVPAPRRLKVAMAAAGIGSYVELVSLTGFGSRHTADRDVKATRASFQRWLSSRTQKLPMDVGLRLSKVFGVPADLLCEGFI